MSERRGQRRSALRKQAMPNAAHYVGYVEEEETPEMIMKKFEELDRILAGSKTSKPRAADAAAAPAAAAAAAPASPSNAGSPGGGSAGQGLDEAQLNEVFKATSIFSVKAIMSNNEALMLKQARGGAQDWDGCSDGGAMTDSDEDVLAELKGFWSDEDWDTMKKQR